MTFWKYRDRILYWHYLHDDFRGFIMNHQTNYFLEYIRMLPEGSVTVLYELHMTYLMTQRRKIKNGH
jgi:hypothetical protein